MTIAQAAGWWLEVDKKGDYIAFSKKIQQTLHWRALTVKRIILTIHYDYTTIKLKNFDPVLGSFRHLKNPSLR